MDTNKTFTITTDKGTNIEMQAGQEIDISIDGIDYIISIQEK